MRSSELLALAGFDRIRRLRAKLAGLRQLRKEAVPYLTRFTAPDTSISGKPEFDEFPGLIFLEYADVNSGKSEITAYWNSREAAANCAIPLGKALQVGSPVAEGYLRQLKGREESWLKRVPVGHWILYAASLFGALVVIEDYFARLFEKPDIVLEIPDRDVANVLVADEINIDLGVTNRSRDVHSIITFSAPSLERSDGTVIRHRFWSNLTPPPIAPSATNVLEIKGAPLPAGLYKLTIAAQAKAGYFRSSKSFSTFRTVRAWNREPEVILESINPESPRRAWLKGKVLVGLEAPNGLNCQATIQKSPSVKFGFVDFPGVRTWEDLPDASTPGFEVCSRMFKAENKLDGLSDSAFRISLEASGAVDWKTISTKASIVCERDLRREESLR